VKGYSHRRILEAVRHFVDQGINWQALPASSRLGAGSASSPAVDAGRAEVPRLDPVK
jgi:hypothetical protein